MNCRTLQIEEPERPNALLFDQGNDNQNKFTVISQDQLYHWDQQNINKNLNYKYYTNFENHMMF